MAKYAIKSTIAHTAVISPFCTVTVALRLAAYDRRGGEERCLTPDDPVEDVVCAAETGLVPALWRAHQTRGTQLRWQPSLTKCHVRERVIVLSQIAAPMSQMITTTRNFWNSSNCGT